MGQVQQNRADPLWAEKLKPQGQLLTRPKNKNEIKIELTHYVMANRLN